MSNHSGSYMLNSVLEIVKEIGISELIGKEKYRELALELIKLGNRNDCNAGEILEDIGREVGLCYCCLEASDDIEDDICIDCR